MARLHCSVCRKSIKIYGHKLLKIEKAEIRQMMKMMKTKARTRKYRGGGVDKRLHLWPRLRFVRTVVECKEKKSSDEF